MRPGQLTPNDFELAILEWLAGMEPSISASVEQLHVLSREFTGVGSFTKFKCGQSTGGGTARHVGLEAMISMPGVPNGMGAVLHCKGDQPDCLEIFTYGDDHWDGMHEGFSIETAHA